MIEEKFLSFNTHYKQFFKAPFNIATDNQRIFFNCDKTIMSEVRNYKNSATLFFNIAKKYYENGQYCVSLEFDSDILVKWSPYYPNICSILVKDEKKNGYIIFLDVKYVNEDIIVTKMNLNLQNVMAFCFLYHKDRSNERNNSIFCLKKINNKLYKIIYQFNIDTNNNVNLTKRDRKTATESHILDCFQMDDKILMLKYSDKLKKNRIIFDNYILIFYDDSVLVVDKPETLTRWKPQEDVAQNRTVIGVSSYNTARYFISKKKDAFIFNKYVMESFKAEPETEQIDYYFSTYNLDYSLNETQSNELSSDSSVITRNNPSYVRETLDKVREVLAFKLA